nr:retrovirus-related Pol polyprotein from transposon TNT 1-94 [Tanacetum cinerariifolium]
NPNKNEVNEIRAERLARTANLLALVAQQQLVYHPQNHPTHYTQNSSTRSQQAATRNIGKAIVNSPPPIYDQEPTMVAEDNEIGIVYDNQRIVNIVGARENVGTPVVQQYGSQCYNCKEYRHVARECQTPKRVKDAAYHKEKMLLCKQKEAGFQLNAEQADWRDDTDDEPDDQELEAHYIEHPEQSKSINDTYSIEQDEHNVIIDSLDMRYDREQVDQDDNDDLANERDLLASLIEKLKCEIDDSKNRNKFLKTSNKALVDKLKDEIEDFKTKNKSLESSNNHFKVANNELSKTNQLMFKDLKKFQAELDRYHDVRYASKVKIDCAKSKGDLMSYKMEYEKSFNEYTRKINDLNQTISEMKKELFAHQDTISILSQEKAAQIKFYKTRKDKEIDKFIALENKVKVLDNIVYKTGQSVQTMNMLNRNCKTSFAKPEFLKKAQRANPRLYDIGCYNDNLALMLTPEYDEVIRLEKESRSKLSDLIRPFDYEKLNNLYDLFVPQRENSSAQRKRIDKSIPWDQKCKSSKELFKIKKGVATIFDGVERCKQTIAKRTYFGHIDPFIQNTIEGNFCPQIRSINADLEKFHLCLKEETVADLRYFNSLELEVDSLKSQLETQKTQFLNEIDRLSKEYYYADHMNAILGVISSTSVSRPQLKSNQMENRVMLNNSQGKKQEVKDHRRSVMFSNNKTFGTACNNSLNTKTSNVNFVCVTCGKCVLNDNHDKCVLYYLNGVNSRTKMPMAVPISTREPKRIVNQSVATPFRRTVASESTNQKPRHTTRKLYEHVTKTCRTVKFENDQIAPILGYEDLVQGTVTIKRVYYVEGQNHNLFSVSQFCDADLEVAFRKSTCYFRDLKGNDILTGGTETTLNELDFLFSLMVDELLNGSTQVVSKSFAVTTADAPIQCQQQHTTPLNTQTTPKPTCQEVAYMKKVPYASAVGSIMYDVRCTRPDVAFAQNLASRYQQNLGKLHWVAVKHILKYLSNTRDIFLVYGEKPDTELDVTGFCDTSWKCDKDDTKSQTGYVFVVNGGAVDWKSKKQTTTAMH